SSHSASCSCSRTAAWSSTRLRWSRSCCRLLLGHPRLRGGPFLLAHGAHRLDRRSAEHPEATVRVAAPRGGTGARGRAVTRGRHARAVVRARRARGGRAHRRTRPPPHRSVTGRAIGGLANPGRGCEVLVRALDRAAEAAVPGP